MPSTEAPSGVDSANVDSFRVVCNGLSVVFGDPSVANVTVDCDCWKGWLLGSLVVISDICDTNKVDVEVAPVVDTLPSLVGAVDGVDVFGVVAVSVDGGVDVGGVAVVAVVFAAVVAVDGGVDVVDGVVVGIAVVESVKAAVVCSNVVISIAVGAEVVPVWHAPPMLYRYMIMKDSR